MGIEGIGDKLLRYSALASIELSFYHDTHNKIPGEWHKSLVRKECIIHRGEGGGGLYSIV